MRRVNVTCQWATMVFLVLYFLTFVNEFRQVTVSPEVKVVHPVRRAVVV